MATRYDTNHLDQSQFETGSRGRVLKNLLGIRGRRTMDALEAIKLYPVALANLYASAIFPQECLFDFRAMHKQYVEHGGF